MSREYDVFGNVTKELHYDTDGGTDQPAQHCESLLACNGGFAGFGQALAACRPLYGRVRLAGLLQMIGAALGVLLAGAAVALQTNVVPLVVCGHLLLWSGITWMAAGLGRTVD